MTRLRRLVSGGQTGVDRAALDAALERGFPCGGWCPRGRLAEDGPLDARYPLVETPDPVYAQRTEWNARDTDATLVLTIAEPSEGTAYTIDMARGYGRPCLVLNPLDSDAFEQATDWLARFGVETLNVAGPRGSKSPEIYDAARALIERLIDWSNGNQ